MKSSLLFLSLLLCLSGSLNSQTKKIAHKSHSGSAITFSAAYRNELFALSASNFGLDPNAQKRYTTPVFVPSFADSSKTETQPKKEELKKDPEKKPKKEKKYKKNTAVNTSNPAGSGTSKKQSTSVIPIAPDSNDTGAKNNPGALYIGLLALFSIFAGMFSWQYKTV